MYVTYEYLIILEHVQKALSILPCTYLHMHLPEGP